MHSSTPLIVIVSKSIVAKELLTKSNLLVGIGLIFVIDLF